MDLDLDFVVGSIRIRDIDSPIIISLLDLKNSNVARHLNSGSGHDWSGQFHAYAFIIL